MAQSASELAWVEIKRLYIESDETVESIARRFGLSVRVVYARVAKEGWPRRSLRRARSVGTTGPLAVSGGDPARTARLALEKRLYQLMIRKLEKLEKRMDSAEAVSPADNEREMREIGTMIRGFEKVKEVGAADGNAERSAGRPGLATTADVDRMRQEIADRLERLHRRWTAPPGTL